MDRVRQKIVAATMKAAQTEANKFADIASATTSFDTAGIQLKVIGNQQALRAATMLFQLSQNGETDDQRHFVRFLLAVDRLLVNLGATPVEGSEADEDETPDVDVKSSKKVREQPVSDEEQEVVEADEKWS